MRKHGDTKLVTTERTRNYLVSQPNSHTTKFFSEKLIGIEMKKTETIMNKPVCLGLSVIELNKILMYESCYDNIKSKYSEKVKFCYMDTYSFIRYKKTDDIYKKIAEDVETRFDT